MEARVTMNKMHDWQKPVGSSDELSERLTFYSAEPFYAGDESMYTPTL
jgi:hypothetical protein